MNPQKIAHLSWISAPLEKSIALCKQAMMGITKQHERLKNPPSGAEAVWFVNQNEVLDQSKEALTKELADIEASLELVQCSGGQMLATEIRTLASVALAMDSPDEQEKCLLAIQTAMNILPSFIGMVIDGAHDSPGVLLKYANELRALRQVSPLTDSSALPINLTFAYTSPPLHESDCDLAERERVFNNASTNFCLLYSQAMKNKTEAPWIEMRDHLRELQRVTNDPELGCYWWVGEAIVDVIIADGFYLPPAMNTALRVVMVATQRIPQGEAAVKVNLNPGKFSALLNSLSISRRQTPTSGEVIKHFDVKENVEEDRIEQLQEMLQAQSVQTIADVMSEIKPRLETAMVSFGRGITSKHDEGFRVQMQAFDQAIRTIANVFGIFNESDLSELCFELADTVKGVKNPKEFTSEAIETVKGQILFLDARLTHLDRNQAAELLQIKDVTSDVSDVIAKVTYAEIRKLSHIIATHVDSGVGSEKLLEALKTLHELAKVFEFAGSMTIGSVLGAVVTTITEGVEGGVLGESESLTLSARALVCIEMYLQYINAGLQPPLSLLDSATEAIKALGKDVRAVEIVSHSDLLAKFEASANAESDIDPLLSEIFELRPHIDALHRNFRVQEAGKLGQFATTCFRLGAAASIKSENQFAALCRKSAELAQAAPGRVDDPAYDPKAAHALLSRSSELILRSMDEYSSKGKINLFLVDAIESITSFIGYESGNGEASTVGSAEPESTGRAAEKRQLPDGIDPILQNLFDEEFSEHLGTISTYVAGSDLVVTDTVCRAIHSILGCSGSAGCTVVNTVFDVLESRFYELKAREDSLTAEQAAELADLLSEIASYQNDFPWTVETTLLPAWLEIAATMVGTKSTPAASSSPEAPVDAYDQNDEPPSSEAPASNNASDAAPEEPEYNVEEYDLYLCDSDDVIPELQQNVQGWMADMTDTDLALCIRRNMHTLKGAAAVIGASSILTLTHHMETLFDMMAAGSIQADKPCADLVTFVLDELITMSEAVRRKEAYKKNAPLIDFVEKSCEILRVDGEELAATISTSYGKSLKQPATPNVVEQPDQLETPTRLEEERVQADATPEAESSSSNDNEEQASFANPGETSPADIPPSAPSHEDLNPADSLAQDPYNAPELDAPEQVSGGENPKAGTRRGYRGLRGRAVGERKKNWENRQASKATRENDNPSAAPAPVVAIEIPPALPLQDNAPIEMSQQVQNLLQRASESDKEAGRSKKKSQSSEKIRVDLMLLDKAIQLANELKASSYRQNTLYREHLLSIIALREKLSLHLMHHNKATVQLRNFNNMTESLGPNVEDSVNDDQQRLYLERFNHLSYSNTQSGVQIEQMLQDCQDVITQSHLMENAFKHEAEVVASVQRSLMLSRLVSFGNELPVVTGALTRAKQVTQKQAELEFLNRETLIDRQLLESIRDPLRHIINNSVAHGIEAPDVREKIGKNPVGRITVSATRRSKTLVISIEDDGQGINPEAVRRKAIKAGLIKEEDVLTDRELVGLITKDGFSMADTVNELAGRGVGMDIVSNKIAELDGQLIINTNLGTGTRIDVELPLTVGSNRALVCSVGDQWYAIPTFNMTQVMDYPSQNLLAMKAKSGRAVVDFEGYAYDVVHLADLIAIPDLKVAAAHSMSHTSLILVEQNEIRLAIEVERGISMPEIHVNKFEGILSSVKGIVGSTEIHDGTPALVLDVMELARLNLKLTPEGYKPKLYRIRRVRREAKPIVLVVDDSNSYRRLLSSHFQSLGWEVITARDGQDALDQLPAMSQPTLFVVDVEMPRMDGLELTKNLRQKPQFGNTPIIMLTTRSNLKDTALELGVNRFLPKPYDAPLLNEAILAVCPQHEDLGVTS